jgi:1-acyl-sn-glycerol-3-phosphate acyltransferase
MKRLLGYILTPITATFYFLVLLIFQPFQWAAYKFFGYNAHKKMVDALNFSLVSCMYLSGDTATFINKQQLPQNRPIIFIANHQSLFDIPPLGWFLRKYHPKFISKIELTRGIPSISFNLKYGGAANIDRKDPRQSITEIVKLALRMKENNWSAVIFPEGTRSKDGRVKTFQSAGIATILKKCPEALLVPIVVKNSWKMVRYGKFPFDTFINMKLEVLAPIEPGKTPADELVLQAENDIKKALGQV